MSKTQHTPGPWRVETFDGPREYASIEAGDGISELVRICDIPSWPVAVDEMKANARLIAAAPDLLAALERLVEKVHRANAIQHSGGEILPEDWGEIYDLTGDARAALTKAKAQP